MRLDVHHHVESSRIEQKLDAILIKLTRMEAKMASAEDTLDAITTALQNQSTVEDSVLALLTSIKNQLADALRGEQLSAGAQAKLAAIMPLLEANTSKLSAALVANTPAADTPASPAPAAPADQSSVPPAPSTDGSNSAPTT
jgi:hypothetical protein